MLKRKSAIGFIDIMSDLIDFLFSFVYFDLLCC